MAPVEMTHESTAPIRFDDNSSDAFYAAVENCSASAQWGISRLFVLTAETLEIAELAVRKYD
jgi:hypothetical protein